MSKKVTTQVDYPVDVETAWAATTAEGWVERHAAESGSSNASTSREEVGGELVVVLSRSLPEGLPGALTKVIPAGLRPTQTDRWDSAPRDGARHGSFRVDSPGVPIEVWGTLRLEPTSTGSRLVTDTEVKVKLPVIGGKLEGYLVDVTRKQALEDGAATARLLAHQEG